MQRWTGILQCRRAARNVKVVSVDPLYEFSVPQIRRRIADTAPAIAGQLRSNAGDFLWHHFKSVDELVAARMHAMQIFLGDFVGAGARPLCAGGTAELPFFDGTFDLALCSHFLFLYSEHHDTQFHVQAAQELCRVAQEVRIFPAGGVERRDLTASAGSDCGPEHRGLRRND